MDNTPNGAPMMDNNQNMNMTNSGSNDTLLAYVAYIIFFIPLLVGTKSEFVKFHTNQGTVLFIFSIVLQVVLSFFIIIPIIGWLMQLGRFIPLVLWIMGLINVSRNEMKPLPLIGGFTIIK